MSEKSYLIDSNIIIYYLNNDAIAKGFLFENIIAATAQVYNLTLVTRNGECKNNCVNPKIKSI
jgi:predicted nucleic acid-binding protein